MGRKGFGEGGEAQEALMELEAFAPAEMGDGGDEDEGDTCIADEPSAMAGIVGSVPIALGEALVAEALRKGEVVELLVGDVADGARRGDVVAIEGFVEMTHALEGLEEGEVENEVFKGVQIVAGNRCKVVGVAIDFIPQIGKGIAERKHGMDDMGADGFGGEIEVVRGGGGEAEALDVEDCHVEVVRLHKGKGLGIGFGRKGVVGIEEGEGVGLDALEGADAGGVEAMVGLVENVDAGVFSGVGVSDGAGGVGGAVVDNPNLKGVMVLRKQTVECTGKGALGIVGGENHGESLHRGYYSIKQKKKHEKGF